MPQQFEINFDAGLTERFPDFRDVLSAAVYGCGKPFKAVAADLDMSSSLLSQMLSGTNCRFPADRLQELINACGPKGQIIWQWLVEKNGESEESRFKRDMRAAVEAASVLSAFAERHKDKLEDQK